MTEYPYSAASLPAESLNTEADGLRELLRLREADVNHLGELLAKTCKERDAARQQASTYRDALLALGRRNDNRSFMQRIADTIYAAPQLDAELVKALGLHSVGGI